MSQLSIAFALPCDRPLAITCQHRADLLRAITCLRVQDAVEMLAELGRPVSPRRVLILDTHTWRSRAMRTAGKSLRRDFSHLQLVGSERSNRQQIARKKAISTLEQRRHRWGYSIDQLRRIRTAAGLVSLHFPDDPYACYAVELMRLAAAPKNLAGHAAARLDFLLSDDSGGA